MIYIQLRSSFSRTGLEVSTLFRIVKGLPVLYCYSAVPGGFCSTSLDNTVSSIAEHNTTTDV